ncbi:MAG: hypothetical protein CMJ18_08475 [Phycisphaeraceae bacterium]|nr:hypothetical protein [Phycisphaeraceae bacterium]
MAKQILVVGTAHPHVFGIANAVEHARDCALVGVWDDDPQRLEAAQERLGVRGIADLDEAFGHDPALVIIGAVPCDRAGLAVRALSSGAAVLVDKPLAVTHEALDGLIAAQRQHGQPVITYYPYRGHPAVQVAKRMIDEGRIGRVVHLVGCGPHRLNPETRPSWHFTRAENGGCIIDVGSHYADVCCWMTGLVPEYICATHTNVSQPAHGEFQDFAQAHLRFPGGILAHIQADWLTPQSFKRFGDSRIWIQGTEGRIEMRHGDEMINQFWTNDDRAQPIDVTGVPGLEAWDTKLIEDLAHGRSCGIEQEEVWRATRVTLYAFDSATAGGKPIENPKF